MAETVSQAVVFLNHFRDLPDPRQAGKALYPLEEVMLLSRLRGLGVRRNTAVRGLKVQQKCREGSGRKRPNRLKPFASTSRKTGSPNLTDCCFERFSPWGDLADLVLHRATHAHAVATFAIALMLTIEVGVAIAFAAAWFTWKQVGESRAV